MVAEVANTHAFGIDSRQLPLALTADLAARASATLAVALRISLEDFSLASEGCIAELTVRFI